MIFRLVFFVLMAVGLGGFGVVAWIATRPPPTPAQGVPATVQVLASARPLDGGSLLKPEDITSLRVPRGKEGEGTAPDTAEERQALVGAMLLHSLGGGAVLRASDLLHSGDRGFLAAALKPGMRAVTVGVDAITGTAGLIWPGDHVDLILTQTFASGALPPDRRIAAETVLSNVRVIAIDQRLVQGATSEKEQQQARTVTLEVSPMQAEHVSVATHLGRLSLAVRAAQPATLPEAVPQAAWAGDVSATLRAGDAPGAPGSVVIYQGSTDGKEFHF
ncbi:Flp pilus assembly protein CpaB [Gluconacetobacter johannae DSM 13595]|uniref:Flp pilus assembly protein CpaB n=1 Tax=Gluconacetobacter johannae TaxID=112140 RepID=A0A7W4J725_9PROT|nr:Flp pilus assembly protein CpaB [Gluconacetobacter johannae]MBB2175821.1 Flp pilus assembly protein CpaB [Gluconacetobacter johannae]GBQ82727.1 Flp pilus assembly protein CpaB [Gluconacetobacter johannae DSM 13595]